MEHLITPSIFSGWTFLRAGMSTRNGGISAPPLGMNLSYRVGDSPENVRNNRAQFLGSFGCSEAETAFAAQCHSSVIRYVSTPGLHAECDALVTREVHLGLAISVADCVPILLADPETRTIGAVHAGWRGSRAGIAGKTISEMTGECGVDVRHVKAFIGPSAGPCCYEVGKDVANQFRPEIRTDRDDRTTLDLKRENALQLLESGVPRENVEVDARCTICGSDLFHSFRRDGNNSGRMLAFIMMEGS